MWIFVEHKTGRILAAGRGNGNPANHDSAMGSIVAVPEQKLDLYSEGPMGLPQLRELYYPKDVLEYTAEEKRARVDRDTDSAICAAIHPNAPLGEQIGILRRRILQLEKALLATGVVVEASADFERMNKIATAAVAAGRAKKQELGV